MSETPYRTPAPRPESTWRQRLTVSAVVVPVVTIGILVLSARFVLRFMVGMAGQGRVACVVDVLGVFASLAIVVTLMFSAFEWCRLNWDKPVCRKKGDS